MFNGMTRAAGGNLRGLKGLEGPDNARHGRMHVHEVSGSRCRAMQSWRVAGRHSARAGDDPRSPTGTGTGRGGQEKKSNVVPAKRMLLSSMVYAVTCVHSIVWYTIPIPFPRAQSIPSKGEKTAHQRSYSSSSSSPHTHHHDPRTIISPALLGLHSPARITWTRWTAQNKQMID